MSSDIKEWLEQNGLGEHAEAFVANEIDLDAARDLTENDLRELGIAMGPRKKLIRAIDALSLGEKPEIIVPQPAVSVAEPEAKPVGGERRQVTVLFADISGYTKMSSDMDAEEIHALISTYFRVVDDIIESFGGSVDKHIGDSTMAVFGAPVAYGNDPERAVRAAVAIHQAMPGISDEVGRTIKAHIGVASGQVVASGIGSDGHYTVTGDSVNLASRLTDKASADETYISATVQLAVGSQCISDPLGALELKGIPEPVLSFRLRTVDAAKSVPERIDAKTFVGRHVELQQFSAILSSCAETGNGHVVYLRGEAGIGKTRLTEELETMALKSGFHSHRSLILDFGVGKGQDAVRSLVRSLLSDQTSDKVDWSAVAARAIGDNLIPENQSMFLNDLLDIPHSGQALSLYNAMNSDKRNQGKRDTVASLVGALSTQSRLILIIEDMHWADDLVTSHFAELARTIANIPVILMLTSRIEGDRIDEAWRATTASTPMITLDLRPLQPEDAMMLASEFLETSSQFAVSCVERADGNPLFLEQLLRSAESSAEKGVPASIQSIVQARMDGLVPIDKQALQVASILGQRFSLDALRNLIGSVQYDCGPLIENYLVRPEGDTFLFAHALVRDGVYNSLLTAYRCELHRQAALWYQNRDLTLYAQHLDRAGDEQAGQAYLQAAKVQVDALHFETVVKLGRRGVEVGGNAETLCGLGCILGQALLDTGETEAAIAAYEAALASANDDARRCQVWIGWAAALRVSGQQETALAILDDAEQAASRQDLVAELAHIHHLRGNLFFPLGKIDNCMREHEQSLKLARQIHSPKAEAHALSGLADAYYLKGHMATSLDRFQTCVEVCREHGFAQIEVENRHMIGWTHMYQMEFHKAKIDALAGIDLATEVRHNRALMFGCMLSGILGHLTRDNKLAEEQLKNSLELSDIMGSGNFSAQTLGWQAMLRFEQGYTEDANELANKALGHIRKAGMTFIGPTVLSIFAAVTDDVDQKLEALAEAEDILDSGCVAHNQLFFANFAIEDALGRKDWDAIVRYTDRLKTYTSGQPLVWSDFIIARANALFAWNNDDKSATLDASIDQLIQQATEAGFQPALPALISTR